MRTEIEFRRLYHSVLQKFNLGPLVTHLLEKIMAGSEKSDDYEEILKSDRFFTTAVCQLASDSLKSSSIKSLSHAVVLVGQDSVRNMVLGHALSRITDTKADENFLSFDETANKLNYSLLAEEQAKKIKCEFTGIAFAAGYIFDIFSKLIATDVKLSQEFTPLLESSWKHGLRAASLAWAISSHERVLISYRKIIFAATLLHDIGKLALAIYDPTHYKLCLEKMLKAKDENPSDDSYEVQVEKEFFDMSHSEAGSALLFRTGFLKEIALEVDFHHDGTLLKTRNQDAFLGGAVLNISDRVSWISEKDPHFQIGDLQAVLKPHQNYFPLSTQEVMDIFAGMRTRRLL